MSDVKHSIRIGIDRPGEDIAPHAGVEVIRGLTEERANTIVTLGSALKEEVQELLKEGLVFVCERRDQS